jgi:hypothetical protein
MSRGPTPVSGSHIRRVGSLLRLDEDKPCVSCVRLNFARNLIEIGLWYSSVVIDIGSGGSTLLTLLGGILQLLWLHIR